VDACSTLALNAWKAIRAEDAGRVDIRFDEFGKAYFLEVNPLAGLHPVHSDLPIVAGLYGIPYPVLMKMIMDSAVEKIKYRKHEKSSPAYKSNV
jgi:D-alanine-D-alanine ligase